jgi:hypothetical protein
MSGVVHKSLHHLTREIVVSWCGVKLTGPKSVDNATIIAAEVTCKKCQRCIRIHESRDKLRVWANKRLKRQ